MRLPPPPSTTTSTATIHHAPPYHFHHCHPPARSTCSLQVAEKIRMTVHPDATIIFGASFDNTLEDAIKVSVRMPPGHPFSHPSICPSIHSPTSPPTQLEQVDRQTAKWSRLTAALIECYLECAAYPAQFRFSNVRVRQVICTGLDANNFEDPHKAHPTPRTQQKEEASEGGLWGFFKRHF